MSEAVQDEVWDRYEAGETLTEIGRAVGRPMTTVRSFVLRHDSRRPVPPTVWSELRLSAGEREEISRGLVVEESFRVIAGRIGRAASTVSREVNANGGRDAYRAHAGEVSARLRACRPKQRRLATDQRLRGVVEAKLAEWWSPEQIAGWLKLEYPNQSEMWLAHEAIYLALYAGDVVKPQAKDCLRTGRPRRRRQGRAHRNGAGKIRNPVLITARPAHVELRQQEGHWEGDLIIGAGSSALATVVERVTRYTLLVPLPGLRTMDALNQALTEVFGQFPGHLVRSLTWDQGKEIAGHEALAAATGLAVYLCEPHSPWQRGTNENTNGLLRQYLPRSTDLYDLATAEVHRIAVSLNNRPRQTLGWRTPTQALQTTGWKPIDYPHAQRVASTA
jgi:IS30 family transposase